MKIRLWSDLHLEFVGKFDHIWTPSEEDKDVVLLLAGDIHLGNNAEIFIDALCKSFKEVLYIHGNHEYYNNDFLHVNESWKRYEKNGPKNFSFLYNDFRIIDEIRFIGGTMWTSFNNADPMVMQAAQTGMNDYVQISCQGEKIRPMFVLWEHQKFVSFLKEQLAQPFEGKTVVMSHHSPGNALMNNGRVINMLDACYYADLDNLIGYSDIALWVHGHTHQSKDYLIGNTRIMCNPYGYHNYATNPDFKKDIILEV